MRGGVQRRRVAGPVSRLVLMAVVAFGSVGAHADDIARGDSAWAGRAEGEREGRSQPGPILDAVGSYQRALVQSPGDLEARWKLLRALHFAGGFAVQDEAEKLAIFDRAREISEEGLDLLGIRAGAGVRLEELDPKSVRGRLAAANVAASNVARLYFWSAISWGGWSRTVGLLSAVRQGVANRLHAELPRVPFVTGWVDRTQALPLVERAYTMAPTNPGNRLLLALTLLDFSPERRDEALALLGQVQELAPRPTMRIEDLAIRDEATKRLDAARSESA
jgi:hypothetical protein